MSGTHHPINNILVRKTTNFYLLRGPTTVLVVIASFFLPYLKEKCTARIVLHLAVANLGLIWIYRDASSMLKSMACSGLNFVLNKIVLDDVLRAIYDPIDGIWACWVGTYVGASTMYGLQMSEDQRTELVQASLGLTNESEAHSVLLEPGGCKILFPIEIQNWLRSSQTDEVKGKSPCVATALSNNFDSLSSTDRGDLESDNIASDNDTLDGNSHDTYSFEKYSENGEQKIITCHDDIVDSVKCERTRQTSETKTLEKPGECGVRHDQADPVAVFFKIIQKMAKAKMKACAAALPRSKIESIGIAATIALGMQLALRRSSKKSHLIEWFCASTAIISFGTNFSREAFLGNLNKKQTMQIICKDLALSILNKIKAKSASNKALTAMLVLVMFCGRTQVKMGAPVKNAFRER